MNSNASIKKSGSHEHPRDSRLLETRHPVQLLAALCGIIALAAPLFLLSQPALAASERDEPLPKVLRVGLMAGIFVDTNTSEAQVAIELWAREMARILGMKSSAKVYIFPDLSSMSGALRRGTLDIICLPCVDYIKTRNSLSVDPLFVAANSVGQGREHLLITRRDSGIRSFSDLRGKNITLLPPAKQEASHIWLDVLLMKEGKRVRTGYFRQVGESSTASQAIMAVFFRQTDAAIVSRGTFETAVALNPQLGHRTRVVTKSASLAGEVTCVPSTTGENMRRRIMNAAMQMTETSVGRQMSVLFQIDRLIPYKPSYLDGLAGLLREQANLRGKLARRR